MKTHYPRIIIGLLVSNILIFRPSSSFSQVNIDILQGDSAWFCPGDTFVLSATPGLLNYLWSNGLTSDSIKVTNPGIYTVSTVGFMGVGSDSDQIWLGMYPQPPQVQLNTIQSLVNICEGDEASFSVANASQFNGFDWNYDHSNQPSIAIDSSGLFWVTAWDGNGCRDTSSFFTVLKNPNPQPWLGPDATVCSLDSLQLSPGNYVNFAWSTGSNSSSIFVSSAGEFSVTVTDTNNCTGSDTISISEIPSPVVNLGNDTTICIGALLVLDAGEGYISYLWQDGSSGQTLAVTSPGTYTVIVRADNGCNSGVEIISVSVNSPVSPTITSTGTTLSVSPHAHHQWYEDSVKIPGATQEIFRPKHTGNYHVIVTNDYGCQAPSEEVFWELKVNIIQAYTPNGDGIGDNFYLENIELFPGALLRVFNRWGGLVYEKEGYDNSWNGYSNEGRELPDGTYFFTLDLKNGSEPVSKYVVINR